MGSIPGAADRGDLANISQLLVDKLCAAKVDFVSLSKLLKLCYKSLEKTDEKKISISTTHKLCTALATCFFLLLERENDNFPETLSYIHTTLSCMSTIRSKSVSSHILCRALLERTLAYGHLFNENIDPELISDKLEYGNRVDYEFTSLSKENLKVTLGHRFRRLPNYVHDVKTSTNNRNKLKSDDEGPTESNTKPDKQSINRYLLVEAFKSSIVSIEDFAILFVEFHCPVVFDKTFWPTDEALRVINEKNLSILRRFEQVPPFWDLYELIGASQCLKTCLVLVKALLAAHIALWASATTSTPGDKIVSTSRLIPPLANSGLIPKPLALIVEVIPHLTSNEVFSVLSDIWQYLKDSNSGENTDKQTTKEEERARAKLYMNRVRLFMCERMPGSLFVKIFKGFYTEVAS